MVQGVTTALTLGIGQLRPDPIDDLAVQLARARNENRELQKKIESGDFCIEPVGALPLTRRLMLIVLFVVKSEHGGYLARPDLAVKRSRREASHGTL